MPVIGRIKGIILRMYFEDHAPPHFHAVMNERAAIIAISDGEILRGSLTSKEQKAVREWAEKRKEILQQMWDTQDIYFID